MSSKLLKTQRIKKIEAPLINIVQGSVEWHEAKWGRISASRTADYLPGSRGKYTAAREAYKNQLIEQTLDPFLPPDPNERRPAAMQWGVDNEPAARSRYELEDGVIVEEVGIFLDPKNERICASPDGVYKGTNHLIEIKCPYSAEYHRDLLNLAGFDDAYTDWYAKALEMVKKDINRGQYYWQMQMQMNCCEADSCSFVVFDPRKPVWEEQIIIIPIQRNEEHIKLVRSEAIKLLAEVDEVVEQRRSRRNERQRIPASTRSCDTEQAGAA